MTRSSAPVNVTPDSCTECPLISSRRTFLRNAAWVAGIAALVTNAIPFNKASALSVVATTGVRDPGDTVSYPIPTQDGAQIDSDNQVILVRWQKAVYAFNLSCPHQNTALRWDSADSRFQCPKHHSKYQPDGTFIDGRATRNMDRFAIKRDGNKVVVDLNTLYESSKEKDAWNAAVIHLDT